MTWYEDEISNRARPAELYEFIGALTTYRYTSHGYDLVFGGNTYTSVPLASSSISGDVEGQQDAAEIEIDRGVQLVLDYAFAVAPRSLSCVIYRMHETTGNFRRWWGGKVTGITIRGDVAHLRVPSLLADALEAEIPARRYQRHCNHVLYDARCGISATAFDVATTISAISGDGKQITVADDGGNPDQWFKGGHIEGSDGEKRLILDHTGLVLKISWPFVAQAPMDNVTLFAGCDHTFATCIAKFSNGDNFGGFPRIPATNIFRNHLGIKGSEDFED